MSENRESAMRYSLLGEPLVYPDEEGDEEEDGPSGDCCDVCTEPDPEDELFFCQACKWNFCDRCWSSQAVHNPRRKTTKPTEHVKLALAVVRLVQPAFATLADNKDLEKNLTNEEDAAWFGVGRQLTKDSPLFFHDYGRYAGLMAATSASLKTNQRPGTDEWPFTNPRTPSLVSFVGQTGAGKSTLIKLLIQIKESEGALDYHRPVVGLPGKDVPTSEDVHLYLDPVSSLSTSPILYADCEGIDGGAREPVAATSRYKREAAEAEWDNLDPGSLQPSSKRELHWAKTPQERTRQFLVAKFYPRLLFTFSDVVIFVHRNPRTVENVLEKLIEWATDALEASNNHPVLPHAIIVLNTSHANINPGLWDVDIATKVLLDSLSKTVHQNVNFATYAKFWKSRGKAIRSVEDLMMCYYSSVKVVHLPADTQPKLVLDQANKLYSAITLGSQAARERKSELRMLLDEDSMQHYLQHAFDHYSRTLDVPFDFVQASFLYNPIPANFGGSILKLAIALKEQQTTPNARAIFDRLSTLIASCILLDAARHKILGTADHIFPQYIKHLDFALSTFCDRHWPCEFVIRTVPDHITYDLSTFKYQNDLHFNTYFFRCANLRVGHGSKGHQLEDGRILCQGKYVSKFSFENNREEFHAGVYYILKEFLQQLPGNDKQDIVQQEAATTLHGTNIQRFLHRPGKDRIINLSDHTVCWSCLFEPPQHTLSCGHVLCTSCVKDYGRVTSRTMVEIHQCPLEPNQTSKLQSIYFKPDTAGIRTLVLDDGGIRGLIQIEILRLLEKEFNNIIPARFFFDLVVGHGAGSIPALGLFATNWSLDECEDKFSTICRKSFSQENARRFRSIPRRLRRSPNSKYNATTFDKVLEKTFMAERVVDPPPLFGAPTTGKLGTNTKVAITATSSSGRATVFPNYNRKDLPLPSYRFFRPEHEQNETRLWEAARASMSDKIFFGPFKHQSSNEVYSHETRNHISNPVIIADTERKSIWPDAPSEYPDLLLWIGTGISNERPSTLEASHRRNSSLTSTRSIWRKKKEKPSHSRLGERGHTNFWDDYLNSLPVDAPTSNLTCLNVKVPTLPAVDDVENMDSFQNMSRKCVDGNEISKLASQIFATFFYFDGEIEETPTKDLFLRGELLCRLSDLTDEIREIGILLQSGQFGSTGFIVQEQSKEIGYLGLTTNVVDDMIFNLRFQVPQVRIRVSSKRPFLNLKIRFEKSEDYSISGFPRSMRENQGSKQSRGDSQDTATICRQPQWRPPDRNRYSLDSSSSIRSFDASSALASPSTTVSTPRELEATSKPSHQSYELHAPEPRANAKVQEAMRVQRLAHERDRIRNEVTPLEDEIRQLEDQKRELADRLKGLEVGQTDEVRNSMLERFPSPPVSPSRMRSESKSTTVRTRDMHGKRVL